MLKAEGEKPHLLFYTKRIGSILHTIHNFHAIASGGVCNHQRALVVGPPLLSQFVAPTDGIAGLLL